MVEAARRVGGRDNVWYPMDLIRFQPDLEKVMLHVFGRALICRDIDTANKVSQIYITEIKPKKKMTI